MEASKSFEKPETWERKIEEIKDTGVRKQYSGERGAPTSCS